MSKPRSLFVSSLLLVSLACHRAGSTAPTAPTGFAGSGPGTSDASPTPAGEVRPTQDGPAAARQPDCAMATIEARPDGWRDGAACVEQLTAGCERSDADACVGASAILLDGSGGAARDPGRSLTLASAACERGVVEGCLIAAAQHDKGIGVAADAATATTFFDRACALGEAGACQVAASRAPKGAASIAGANLQVESIAADGLELRDLMCAVTGGMPMLGALLIAGTLAKQKRALDRCAPTGQAFAVTWTFTGGKARDVTATGGAAAANSCVARAVARTSSMLDGRCGAVVLVGDPTGAAATLDAVRSGK